MNTKQREQFELMFLEAKRFYNFILSEKKRREVPLNLIVPTSYKDITYLDKDKNEVSYTLQILPSHFKQTLVARMISNEKTIRALVKKGLQKHGGLQFKSDIDCIPLKNMDWAFRSKRKVKIMGISGQVLLRGIDQWDGEVEFANANLVRRVDGLFLKITTYIDKSKAKKTERNSKDIGIDFGVHTQMTTSEGEKVDVQVGESERLKKQQRELFRRVKGSSNRRQTIKKIKKSYQKMENKKQDMANKFISKMKAYDHVIFQDDDIHAWHSEEGAKNKGKRRKVQHSCLGLIKAKLKALDNSVAIAKFIPTTKFCRCCGSIKGDLKQEDRTYECHCGHVEDRDVHAAKNMVWIWKTLQEDFNKLPTGHREVTLMDWNKWFSERSGKITSFRM